MMKLDLASLIGTKVLDSVLWTLNMLENTYLQIDTLTTNDQRDYSLPTRYVLKIKT